MLMYHKHLLIIAFALMAFTASILDRKSVV